MKFDIKNNTETSIDLYFYGNIVGDELESWSLDDKFPSIIRDFLSENKGKEINVHMNSGGGSCFGGIAIGEMLKKHDSKTVCHIDGLCASISTYIATCCNEIKVHANSYFMMHNAWCGTCGNKSDLQDMINLLEKMDNSIAEAYLKHSSKTLEEIKELMDNETWLCGKEILDYFNFTLDEEEQVEAYARFDVSKCKNVPKDLLDLLEEEEEDKDDDEEEEIVEPTHDQDDDEEDVAEKSDKTDEEEIDEEKEIEDRCKKKKEEQAKAKKELELLNAKVFLKDLLNK